MCERESERWSGCLNDIPKHIGFVQEPYVNFFYTTKKTVTYFLVHMVQVMTRAYSSISHTRKLDSSFRLLKRALCSK